MIEAIAAAIENQNYPLAKSLLQKLKTGGDSNPWLLFYEAKLNEVQKQTGLARQQYSQLLQESSNSKILVAARQGLTRIIFQETQIKQKNREQALSIAQQEEDYHQLGVLVLNVVSNSEKPALSKLFAEIMGIDPYTARLQLPSRAPKLYKVGSIAQLRVYARELETAGIPCFCTSLASINNIGVYEVEQCISVNNELKIIYEKEPGVRKELTFDWREIHQGVEGIIPLFEERIEFNHRGKEQRKTKTLDYAHLCDLHLTRHNSIIRLCDQTYKFQLLEETTARENWTKLITNLTKQKRELALWSEFTPFAESVRDFQTGLAGIEPRSSLLRREDSYWDTAYQLYSALIFLQKL
ncbi:MAG: hypothetical protein N5P05_003493 [Chroococcopsis gigantea SAG 12.99]|jgi:hypothetical protein|nr:tetratricopeptide repeat protein [Chlorogloea purpurea SAG 13.99]MDV3001887.1 hypothetical protein [Chroococcopsis gigantea SAG 12.99]